jgi:hypothetical protein
MNMLFGNPELQRNLLLKISPLRLAALPIVALVLYWLLQDNGQWKTSAPSFLTYFVMITAFLWGTYEAAGAFSDEIANNTWDFQRTSRISPFNLLIGKLLGETAYMWCFALLGLAFLSHVQGPAFSVADTLMTALIAIGGHATALFLGATDAAAQRETAYGRRRATFINFCGGLAVIWLLDSLATYAPKIPALMSASFFHMTIDNTTFYLCSLLFFVFWICVALYRAIQSALSIPTAPVAWIAFLACLFVYIQGTFHTPMIELATRKIGIVFLAASLFFSIVLVVIGWVLALKESGDTGRYRRLIVALRQKNHRKALENAPLWIITAALAWIIVVFPLSQMRVTADHNMPAFTLALFLFCTRDMIVFHILRLNGNHGTFKTLLYLVVVYILLPLAFNNQTSPAVRAWVHPTEPEHILTAALPPLLYSLVAGGILAWMIRRKKTFNISSGTEKK